MIELNDNQKTWIKWMLKGMGLSGGPKDFNKTETKQMQQLIYAGFVRTGKNHSGAKHVMYYIPEEDRERVKLLIEDL